MSKRSALTLGTRLTLIDSKLHRLYMRDDYRSPDNRLKQDNLESQAREAVAAAIKKGLKVVSVQTCDGYSYYYESKRTSRLVTFEWFYGGGDGYVSPWGKIVCVPISQANKMIKAFSPKDF